ncbi:hypothetical protein JMJ77_0002709 [Colletotrichum scovillei]|uniref:Uncharacterized protein n=1 Tax=Colletotrichum scovillei TaxID=1209932 RepID=A0A9P7UEG9_9PEZI|nr:hypothetical protein JMJ77_0002709 [Colletotrichum scovillei]KAG7071134.1 hypothetical protein JMJ76_0002371 [Colletotrichum scovillei]KAG7079338.1 hypothetical protein JMJ78_0002992 [Colletotrichum scovillei]
MFIKRHERRGKKAVAHGSPAAPFPADFAFTSLPKSAAYAEMRWESSYWDALAWLQTQLRDAVSPDHED